MARDERLDIMITSLCVNGDTNKYVLCLPFMTGGTMQKTSGRKETVDEGKGRGGVSGDRGRAQAPNSGEKRENVHTNTVLTLNIIVKVDIKYTNFSIKNRETKTEAILLLLCGSCSI